MAGHRNRSLEAGEIPLALIAAVAAVEVEAEAAVGSILVRSSMDGMTKVAAVV